MLGLHTAHVLAFLTTISLSHGLVRRPNLSDFLPHFGHHHAHSDGVTHNVTPPFRQELVNMGDLQYTAEMNIGDQRLQVILDTGSFDLLVFSQHCWLCGDMDTLYDDESSSTYSRGPGLTMEHSFGSGSTESVAAFETVEVNGRRHKEQAFWEVFDAYMPILSDSSFQAIVGIGPPVSSVILATSDLQAVQKDEKEYEASGNKVSKRMRSYVENYEKVLEFTKEQPSFLENLGMETFSVCVGHQKGSPGAFVWNDDSVKLQPEVFTTVPVKGDIYWSADLSDVRLSGDNVTQLDCTGSNTASSHDSRRRRRHAQKVTGCTAIVDSGTSLIVAPKAVVDRVQTVIKNWGGQCNNLSELPDLTFMLGSSSFSLPPSSYVGEVCGDYADLDDDMRRLLLHMKDPLSQNQSCACVAMLMADDAPQETSPTWVLGLPFFRKYYTSFQLSSSTRSSHRRRRRRLQSSHAPPHARSMSFALADDQCMPSSRGSAMLRKASKKGNNALKVHAAKIVSPKRVVRHAARQVGGGGGAALRAAGPGART